MDGLRFPAKQAKVMFEVGAAEWIPPGGVRAAGWGLRASDTGAGPPGIKAIQGGQVSCQCGEVEVLLPAGTQQALGPPRRVRPGLTGRAVIVDRGVCLPFDWG